MNSRSKKIANRLVVLFIFNLSKSQMRRTLSVKLWINFALTKTLKLASTCQAPLSQELLFPLIEYQLQVSPSKLLALFFRARMIQSYRLPTMNPRLQKRFFLRKQDGTSRATDLKPSELTMPSLHIQVPPLPTLLTL